MDSVDKARELGAEHGRRDAEAWYSERGYRAKDIRNILDFPDIYRLPEPDIHREFGPENGGWKFWNRVVIPFRQVNEREIAELRGIYCDAYRQARDETIREKVH